MQTHAPKLYRDISRYVFNDRGALLTICHSKHGVGAGKCSFESSRFVQISFDYLNSFLLKSNGLRFVNISCDATKVIELGQLSALENVVDEGASLLASGTKDCELLGHDRQLSYGSEGESANSQLLAEGKFCSRGTRFYATLPVLDRRPNDTKPFRRCAIKCLIMTEVVDCMASLRSSQSERLRISDVPEPAETYSTIFPVHYK